VFHYYLNNVGNKRGNVERSKNRLVRRATHIPVLRECVSALSGSESNLIFIVEHGMGQGSTPYFHTLDHVKQITSFESDPAWAKCTSCAINSLTPHEIVLINDNNVVEHAQRCIIDPTMTITLVDGVAVQRVKVLDAWMKLGVKFIVEHDADAMTPAEVKDRQHLMAVHGYTALQYTDHCPESVLFVKGTIPTLIGNYQPF